jgi:NAD(P)-dependent dehydrogenase (short-subunit alcohol dehydrogenase family)
MSARPVAIVTGAGSGIGRATSLALAKEGYDVALVARGAESLEETARLVQEAAPAPGARTLVIPADVGDRAAIRAAVNHAGEQLGRLDVLVNNAGLATAVPVGKTDEDTLLRSFDVNAIGPAVAIMAAWPFFERGKSGCIVNISTMGTADPFPGFFAYAASKASVNLMARSCAKEGASIGVRAFAVAPGAVETPMLRSLFDPKKVPPAACLSPDDVAGVILACIKGTRNQDNGKTIFLQKGPGGPSERVA